VATHQDVDWARRNGRSSGQYFEGRPLNSERLVEMLVAAAEPGRNAFLRRDANALLEAMALSPWRVAAGPHHGGHGGDPSRHITVKLDDPRGAYHLGLHMNGHIARISGPTRDDGPTPWAPPGAPIPPR
jgi:hypothetical protein